jgi:hypothetical protein
MRTIYFKLTDGSISMFTTNNVSIVLKQALPFGIEYRKQCSCQLSSNEINNWWNYVDELLLENPTFNFKSVWQIVENNIIYGIENL